MLFKNNTNIWQCEKGLSQNEQYRKKQSVTSTFPQIEDFLFLFYKPTW